MLCDPRSFPCVFNKYCAQLTHLTSVLGDYRTPHCQVIKNLLVKQFDCNWFFSFKQKEEEIAHSFTVVSHRDHSSTTLWKLYLSGASASEVQLGQLIHLCKTHQASQAIISVSHEEQEMCALHFSICAERQLQHSALSRSQSSLPRLFQLWKPSPVLRVRGEARCCISQPCCARLEKPVGSNLALSSCKSRGPCQVPVFDSPVYQAVASSFPGHPATFQREWDWWWLGQHRHTASLTSHCSDLAGPWTVLKNWATKTIQGVIHLKNYLASNKVESSK